MTENSNQLEIDFDFDPSIFSSRPYQMVAKSHMKQMIHEGKVHSQTQQNVSSPLDNYFPDYEGGCDLIAAEKYFCKRFLDLNECEDKVIDVRFRSCKDGDSAGRLAFEALEAGPTAKAGLFILETQKLV